MLPDLNKNIYKIILSKPVAGDFTRIEIARNAEKYQAAMYTKKQVFHSNHDYEGIKDFIGGYFGLSFLNYNAWDGEYEYSARVSKKGKMLSSRRKDETKQKSLVQGSFNRQKNRILSENIPFAKGEKLNQINRFLELLDDETNGLAPETLINIIDFGCGKSYLTFLVYHYFTEIRKLPANICGMDLDSEIIKKCSGMAEEYGFSRLKFIQGDIGSQALPPLETWGAESSFNIVISLHACDTATDHALYKAVSWKADLICAVPCCQHELRNQMNPQNLKLFSEYGIIEERIASLATDAIRAKLLETQGYKAQIIEFAAMEHTAKNLMIRAKRTGRVSDSKEIENVLREFSFEPTLSKLFRETGGIK
jgi:SAM-dependent methyltransferase